MRLTPSIALAVPCLALIRCVCWVAARCAPHHAMEHTAESAFPFQRVKRNLNQKQQ